jgi:hypothetical protein
MPANNHAADRALAKEARERVGKDVPTNFPLVLSLSDAIDRLCDEAEQLVLDKGAARDELNRRTLQRDETEHARALLLDDVAALRAKIDAIGALLVEGRYADALQVTYNVQS